MSTLESVRLRILANLEAFQQKHGWCGPEHRLRVLDLIGKYWRKTK